MFKIIFNSFAFELRTQMNLHMGIGRMCHAFISIPEKKTLSKGDIRITENNSEELTKLIRLQLNYQTSQNIVW